ncbi:UPF0764 protein C16orf89 homolog [Styela clava]
MKCYLLIFVLSVSIDVKNAEANTKLESLEPTLENLLNSLENLVNFFSKRYDKLNLDGLFGLRSVQGELRRALEKGESGAYPEVRDNIEIQNKIKSILKVADETAALAYPEVKKKDQEYFSNFMHVIDKPWIMYELKPQAIGKIVKSELPWTKFEDIGDHKPDHFDESVSDKCMGTLFGNQGFKKCDIDVCWEQMTKLDTKLYYTTHQVLWFQLGISVGCLDKFEEKLANSGGLKEMFRKLCTSVVFQMDSLFKNGTVPYQFHDIFLEQGMICGAIGFVNTVNRTWLEGAMKWQHPKLGCFREVNVNPDFDYNMVEDLIYKNKLEWQNRNLLMDVAMGDYCSAHQSAVAAGFYAVYLRLFLDPDYVKNMLLPDLFGEDYESKLIWKRRMQYFVLGFLISFFILYLMGKRRKYIHRRCRFLNFL